MEDTLDLTWVEEESRFVELTHQIRSRNRSRSDGTGNESFTRLIIDCYENDREPIWRSPLIRDFFVCVGTFCQLQSLRLYSVGLHVYEGGGGRFPIDLLTQALKDSSSSSLDELVLQEASLVGTPIDWKQFRKAIAKLQNLKRFVIEDCECVYATLEENDDGEEEGNQANRDGPREDIAAADNDDDVTEETHLDAILSNISGQETLQHLVFQPDDYIRNLRNFTLERLLTQFTALEELRLNNVRYLDNDNMVCLFDAIRNRPLYSCLQELRLEGCIFEVTGVQAFVRFLESNTSRLRSLTLQLAEDGISQALHQEDHLVDVLHAIGNNNTLREFTIWGLSDFTTNVTKAYVELAWTNCNLCYFYIPGAPYPESLTMEFYIKLNQLGRKRFLEDYENTTRNDWIEVLAETPDDVRCIYYFLRLNPLLCEAGSLIG